MVKFKKLIGSLALVTALLTGCANTQKQATNSSQASSQTAQTTSVSNLNQVPNYQSGKSAVIQINNGKSTLDPNSWQTNKIDYGQLDKLNRTSNVTTAYLEKRNLADSSQRETQTVKPTGWHQKKGTNGQMILNRGHLIAYSMTNGFNQNGQYVGSNGGDQNNYRNLFTQTAFANQKLQTVYESEVRDALKANKKIIYQAQPIFEGNNLMAKGIHLQAISTDGSLNFNVFIYNVQPDFAFDYATGYSRVDHEMVVPELENSPSFNN